MRPASRKPAEAAPRRLGALAKLPVFLDLAGRRVVVAGGTAAAAWKVELLAAAGACVDVYARDLSAEMTELVARGAAAGTIIVKPQTWSCAALKGAAIALADIEGEAEAQAFYCAARSVGVPVNVIDKPRFCAFQFGSIVNRSPVVIGISTDGAAPILGQAIRRRIEVLLPPALAAWAGLAKSIRQELMRRVPGKTERRAFWEAFADRAFGPPPPVAADEVMAALLAASAAAPSSNGRVTIVGAGPGEAELLTIKALRALQSADVILYDDLVSDDVLELARREARRMMVGKRGGRDSCRQEDINDTMVKLARQGYHVVRLKSGDPMVFGRAGEEIERLDGENIPVEIVPGITSASAMAAVLGTSLTHREHAQSVRYVTGHAKSGQLPDLDWRGLADPSTTTIFYMAGATARAIAARLIEAGASPTTPCVAAANVSRPDQCTWRGCLRDIAEAGLPEDLPKPVLLGIGAALGVRVPLASAVAKARRAA